ncbi:hypothetical protein FOA43_002171 [Brettanomyces nanus]|uniref:HTH APSES-type domain-containing protein n=1 Tax=Eeniella nana TaxID=13502 RepID=A0A875S395_EENNA|nr:uncharacterized protein FOA43_002171 [Brettanomyces nanus]QPG74835.1 hypothetical protein FOA43_002171 [Brettanomyces nanus]
MYQYMSSGPSRKSEQQHFDSSQLVQTQQLQAQPIKSQTVTQTQAQQQQQQQQQQQLQSQQRRSQPLQSQSQSQSQYTYPVSYEPQGMANMHSSQAASAANDAARTSPNNVAQSVPTYQSYQGQASYPYQGMYTQYGATGTAASNPSLNSADNVVRSTNSSSPAYGSVYYPGSYGTTTSGAHVANQTTGYYQPGYPVQYMYGAAGPPAITANTSVTSDMQHSVLKPKIATTMWEDEKTLCYQVEANGVIVVRRADNDMINGTKLLNVTKMTRGRRDGILKSEKVRHVVKIGSLHLKGIWIPFDRALAMAKREGIYDLLYPIFVKDIARLIQQGTPVSDDPKLNGNLDVSDSSRSLSYSTYNSQPQNQSATQQIPQNQYQSSSQSVSRAPPSHSSSSQSRSTQSSQVPPQQQSLYYYPGYVDQSFYSRQGAQQPQSQVQQSYYPYYSQVPYFQKQTSTNNGSSFQDPKSSEAKQQQKQQQKPIPPSSSTQ